MRHDPGLAASPPARYKLEVERRGQRAFPISRWNRPLRPGAFVREKELARDPPVALAADDHPDRLGRLVAVRAQAVWRRGVERDRVARAELVLVEANAHAEPAAD